jgi:hypothetical protein
MGSRIADLNSRRDRIEVWVEHRFVQLSLISGNSFARARCEADEKSEGLVPKYNISPQRIRSITETKD